MELRLRTEIERVPLRQPLGCREGILLLGSCFTDHIGQWLQESWLPVCCNPWGVLFNPASIAMSLRRVMRECAQPEGVRTVCMPLHELGGRYYSFAHHGRWSDADSERLQQTLQRLEQSVCAHWQATRHVLVTWGTSWVYEREGQVVANCHKFPASHFERRRLTVHEVVEAWAPIIEQTDKHYVFTVSPIRHVKDTLHGNQLSKSVLLLAIDELMTRYPDRVEYLPIYELLVDDLRDYRFYADDLVHPSTLAIQAVRELVAECAFSAEMRSYMAEAAPLVRALQHRPTDPDSPQYQQFRSDTLQSKDALLAKYHVPEVVFAL